MSELQLPTIEQADGIVLDLHKRAFFGRLAQHGIEPANGKEAAALLDLGLALMNSESSQQKAASEGAYGDGFYAACLAAFTGESSNEAPGFEGLGKQASVEEDYASLLPPALVDSAYKTAWQLAHDPAVYGAAIVKRAANEAAYLEQLGAN